MFFAFAYKGEKQKKEETFITLNFIIRERKKINSAMTTFKKQNKIFDSLGCTYMTCDIVVPC